MRLLLLSNSTLHGYGYLEYALDDIKSFLGDKIKTIAFVPYAGVTVSFDDYTKKVEDKLAPLGYQVKSVHNSDDPVSVINNSDAIAVGGGNTFQLLNLMYESKVLQAIQAKVKAGTPYIGWSAGSNMACPTIKTTNDMPIVQPPSFNALDLIPHQINPHFLDAHPEGFHGETREQRLCEFLAANQTTQVIGLREGSIIKVEDHKYTLLGNNQARIFNYDKNPFEISPGDISNKL